jgi:thiamine biosynthesis protein ThiS
MKLTVNGEEREVAGPMTVLGLIESFGLAPQKIAVERNLEIVPRSAYGEVALRDGDRIEIVNFVGGG